MECGTIIQNLSVIVSKLGIILPCSAQFDEIDLIFKVADFLVFVNVGPDHLLVFAADEVCWAVLGESGAVVDFFAVMDEDFDLVFWVVEDRWCEEFQTEKVS